MHPKKMKLFSFAFFDQSEIFDFVQCNSGRKNSEKNIDINPGQWILAIFYDHADLSYKNGSPKMFQDLRRLYQDIYRLRTKTSYKVLSKVFLFSTFLLKCLSGAVPNFITHQFSATYVDSMLKIETLIRKLSLLQLTLKTESFWLF